LKEIANVLDIEIEALQAVRNNLTPQFEAAVKAIASCRGQVVVAGMGKSGLVANKIAATLRSTGTPAVFLHASEALHGDLGIVSPKDVILAIGKSGETDEVNELLSFVRKRGAKILALTSNTASTMASLADIVLDLGIPREACPLNLAPTASTTVALAVGDALAVAVMKAKAFTSDDFAQLHPGGHLGRRLRLKACDVMKKGAENPVIGVDRSAGEMLRRITAFKVGAIAVIDAEGRLVGLVTDYDVRKAIASGPRMKALNARRIRDIMNPSPVVVFSDERAVDALGMMMRGSKPKAVLPVVDRENKAVGMIHLPDLIARGL
jgi:arabinose-5-phosphate isomerase